MSGPFASGGRRGRAVGKGPPPLPARPTWMVVLASLMVVVAFHLFLGGLSSLADGGAAVLGATRSLGQPPVGAEEATQQALRRGLILAFARVDPTLLRLHSASKIVFAAVLLYAVAAIASGDRRGRRGTLLAAWVGIVYHLSAAFFLMVAVRGGFHAAAGEWMADLTSLGLPLGTPEQAVRIANQALLVLPAGAALLGVAFSVLLLTFFGGRRGRAYYGIAVGVAGAPGNEPEARAGG